MLTPVAEEYVSVTADALQPILDKHPQLEGGLKWNPATAHLEVALVPKGGTLAIRRFVERELQTAVARLTHKVAIEFVDGLESRRTLTDLANRVTKDSAQWAGTHAKGIVRAMPGRVPGKVVVVATPATVSAIRAAAAATYGDRVVVEAGAMPELASGSRYSDPAAEFSAGIPMWFTPTRIDPNTGINTFGVAGAAECTTGFAWTKAGVNYASTAGHCRAVGGSVWHTNAAQRIGVVSNRWWVKGGYLDFELIKITSGAVDAKVWVGPRTASIERDVVSADNNGTVTGITVCAEGANGGHQCGVVTDWGVPIVEKDPVNGSLVPLNGQTCVRMNSGQYTRGGDSGGPVLKTNTDGTVVAYGQVLGGIASLNTDDCGMFYTPVVLISAIAGATLLVN